MQEKFLPLFKIIDNFENAKVLIIGDLIMDQFIWGDVSRISPEAPVPVVLVERESSMPGGAANVAANVSSLGGNSLLTGVVGEDDTGRALRLELSNKRVNVEGIFSDKIRQTTLKTRIVARHQQVVRVDKEIIKEIDSKMMDKIISYIEKHTDSIKAIIIEDYGKGVVIPELIKEVVRYARKRNLIVTVDPKEEHFSYYKGVTCITPNQLEAGKASGVKIVDEKTLLEAGGKLQKEMELEAVLITRGEHGMCLFEKDGKAAHIPTDAQEVFDVSGAGDTVIAAFTLALASGASFLEAAHISNYAAGVVVGKVGVASCSKKELIDRLSRRGEQRC